MPTTILTIDETSGVQNVQTGVTSNDTSAPLPSRFQSALALENPGGGVAISTALSGVDGTPANAGGVNVLTLPANVTDIAFTNANGTPIVGVDSGLMTTDSVKIYLYTSSFDNNVVVGREAGAGGVANPNGALVFAAFLDTGVATGPGDTNATGAKLWLVQFQSMYQPDGTNPNDIVYLSGLLNVTINNLVDFSLEGAPSGQNLFLMFGDGTPAANEAAIIVTGDDPANQSAGASITTGDTVNTGQGGGGTTIGSNNQMIDPAEGMYFTFVKNPNTNYTVPNLDQNEADVEANIQFSQLLGSTGASFTLVQLQPPKAATLTISAFLADVASGGGTPDPSDDTPYTGVNYIDHLDDNTAVNVTSVTIYRTTGKGNNTTTEQFNFAALTGTVVNAGAGLSVDFTGDTALISGLLSGDRIEYATGTTNHNRVLVTNTGDADDADLNAAFDIGGFRLTSGGTSTQPLDDLAFVDDGPSATIVRTTDSATLDESVGLDANDANAEDDDVPPGTDPFAGAYGSPIGAVSGVDLVNTTSSAGQDDEGATTTVTLSIVGGSGADSGLKTTGGTTINLWMEANGTVTGRAGNASATVIFAIKIDGDGKVSVAQYDSLQHPTFPSNYDEELDLANKLNAVVTLTDGDTDVATNSVGIGDAINFQDDGPKINSWSDLIYANASNPTPGGTGFFDYSIGEDQHTAPFSATNSDFSTVSLTSGFVGAGAISNKSVVWASESASTAVFNVSFDYVSNPSLGTTTTATGTLTFDKVADTYALALAAPIQSYTVLTTGTAQGFTGYVLGGTTVDNTQPDVSVATLASNFFVQFSGYSEPGGGTGDNNLNAGVPGVNGGAADDAFVAGELFSQASSWVSVSGTAAGVAGDTIQKGEVLDLDFFTTNPFGNTSLAPTSQTAGIYLKFDGINSEDLVVVLKLVDGVNHTTKAFVVDNADILRNDDTIPAGYSISLDNNDGAVIFESNDFNGAGENWLIEGAQVLVSTEGITGSGVNLNPATGSGGSSSGTQAFGVTTTDNDVVKIVDIGFLTTQTPDTNLRFDVAVVDGDGDATATQSLDVTIVAGAIFAAGSDREAIQGRAAVADTFVFDAIADSPAGANHDVIGGFVSGTDKIDVSGIDANSVGGGANDAFSYINTGAFSNVAGQMRFDAATHMLEGDVNGDSTADFAVELTGVASVAAGDLIL